MVNMKNIICMKLCISWIKTHEYKLKNFLMYIKSKQNQIKDFWTHKLFSMLLTTASPLIKEINQNENTQKLGTEPYLSQVVDPPGTKGGLKFSYGSPKLAFSPRMSHDPGSKAL
jgi:hypothetical protein